MIAKKKTYVNLHIRRFWFEAGWFPGDEVCLFEFSLLKNICDTLLFFHIQVGLLVFNFGVNL